MSKFKESVFKIVSMIPRGKVVSYGQVALYLGMPRAGRQVGWMLNQLEVGSQIPWWRVINNKGYLSIKSLKYDAHEQKELLAKEGIEIGDDFTLNIEEYRFIPNETFIKKLGLDPIYLEMIADKIPYSKSFHK